MEFQYKELNNLYYSVQGDGDVVVLVHGVAASMHDWDVLIPNLVNRGYKAIALDLLGHGNSKKPGDPKFYTSNNVYYAFKKWIDLLPLDKPFIFISHSLGGYIVLRYAINQPSNVRGMVLINPYYRSDQLSPVLKLLNTNPLLSEKAIRITPLWLIDWMLGWDPIKSGRFSPEARYQIAYDYKRAAPYIMHIPNTLTDITTKIPDLPHPVRVIWGEKDQTLNPDSFQQLVELLSIAEGYAIKNAGHQPHIGNPETVNQLILEFVGNLRSETGNLSLKSPNDWKNQ